MFWVCASRGRTLSWLTLPVRRLLTPLSLRSRALCALGGPAGRAPAGWAATGLETLWLAPAKAGSLVARTKVLAPWDGATVWPSTPAPSRWVLGSAEGGGLAITAVAPAPRPRGLATGGGLRAAVRTTRRGGLTAEASRLGVRPRLESGGGLRTATAGTPAVWADMGVTEALGTLWLAPAKAGDPIARAKVHGPWVEALAGPTASGPSPLVLRSVVGGGAATAAAAPAPKPRSLATRGVTRRVGGPLAPALRGRMPRPLVSRHAA